MWNLNGCLRTHQGGKWHKIISTATLHGVAGIKGVRKSGDRLKPTRFPSHLKSGFTLTDKVRRSFRVTRHLCGMRDVSAPARGKGLCTLPGWQSAALPEDGVGALALWGNGEGLWGEMPDLTAGKKTSPHSVYETLDLHPHGTNLASDRGERFAS